MEGIEIVIFFVVAANFSWLIVEATGIPECETGRRSKERIPFIVGLNIYALILTFIFHEVLK